MSDWDHLFRDDAHILREPDIHVVHFARLLRDHGLRRVLDWGCGAGRHVVYLTGLGFKVVGMDPSARAIEEARGWLVSEGLDAELRVAEPGAIPLPAASCEAVLSLYAIEHGDRDALQQSIDEMYRVLQPGGLALVALSSAEDDLKQSGRQVAPGTYAAASGPEAGIPHYLSTRADIDAFFARFEVLELEHIRSRLGALRGEPQVSAHWVMIGHKA